MYSVWSQSYVHKNEFLFCVTGIEARGFIFGPPIALAIGAKFVPLRKPKKLPGMFNSHFNVLQCLFLWIFVKRKVALVLGKVISQEYILEYGRDCLEMHVGGVEHGERALVVDDLVATGGTLCAAMDLLGYFFSFQIISIRYRFYFGLFLRMKRICFMNLYDYEILLTHNNILSERVGAEIVECACVIELPELKVWYN